MRNLEKWVSCLGSKHKSAENPDFIFPLVEVNFYPTSYSTDGRNLTLSCSSCAPTLLPPPSSFKGLAQNQEEGVGPRAHVSSPLHLGTISCSPNPTGISHPFSYILSEPWILTVLTPGLPGAACSLIVFSLISASQDYSTASCSALCVTEHRGGPPQVPQLRHPIELLLVLGYCPRMSPRPL